MKVENSLLKDYRRLDNPQLQHNTNLLECGLSTKAKNLNQVTVKSFAQTENKLLSTSLTRGLTNRLLSQEKLSQHKTFNLTSNYLYKNTGLAAECPKSLYNLEPSFLPLVSSSICMSKNLFQTELHSPCLSSALLPTSSVKLQSSDDISQQNFQDASETNSYYHSLHEVQSLVSFEYDNIRREFLTKPHTYNKKKGNKVSFPTAMIQSKEWGLNATANLKINLIDCVCSSLLNSPNFKKIDDATHMKLKELACNISQTDPEYILKVALYARQDLNVRSTANFLLALSAHIVECRSYLKKYYSASVNLPSDWIAIAELYQSCFACGKKSLPAALRKVMITKFLEFDQYQLAKYNKDATKKARKKKKNIQKDQRQATTNSSKQNMNDVVEHEKNNEDNQQFSFTLKQLIRQLHITKPACHVMCLLGKRYPDDIAEFYKNGLEGTWDASLCGTRMKLPVPETWETQVSARGNYAKVWQDLLDHKALPFMAMLRNIRNLIKAGISEKHHNTVLKILTNKKSVARSRQFPSRFFSAYVILDELEADLKKRELYKAKGIKAFLKQELKDAYDTLKRKFGEYTEKTDEMKQIDMLRRQLFKKYDKPFNFDDMIIIRYRKALNKAVELATCLNVAPIKGHTLIMCEASERMRASCNSAKAIGSKRSLLDISILLALMCANACEQFTFIVYLSPTCYQEIEMENTGILKNLTSILELCSCLADNIGDHSIDRFIPFDYCNKILTDCHYHDNLVVLSKEICSQDQSVMDGFLKRYRDQINSKLMNFQIDLSGKNSRLTTSESFSSRNVKISGYSDQILRYIAEGGGESQLSHVENIDRSKKLRVENDGYLASSLITESQLLLPVKSPVIVRIFISSTVKDMHSERDLLVRYVFPELCRRGAANNIQIVECDLRWGVTTNRDQSVKICLNEVKRCQLFVGLLGDRYGWVPATSDLPQDMDFDWIHSLSSRRSITELEMYEGALRNKEINQGRAFFYIRNGNELNKKIPKKWKNDFMEKPLRSRQKLENLKLKIIESGFPVYENYPCQWSGEIGGMPVVTELESLAARMINDLWSAISHYTSDHQQLNDMENKEDFIVKEAVTKHQQLLQTKSEAFVGRKVFLEICGNNLTPKKVKDSQQNGFVVALSGEPGIGKTSLMSALANSCIGRMNSVTLIHYVGSNVIMSNDLSFLLNGFSYQLASHINKNVEKLPLSLDESTALFWKYVEIATKSYHLTVYMFIDQLDILMDNSGSKNLQWMPDLLPANVVLVVSCLEGKKAKEILELRRDVVILQCPPLQLMDKSVVVKKMLSKHSKALDSSHFNNQLQRLTLKRGSCIPLYLHTACEYLRLFANFSSLGKILANLPHDLPGLLQLWLKKAETYISSMADSTIIPLTMMIIYCCERGIEEEELFQILTFWNNLFLLKEQRGELRSKLTRVKFCHVLHLLSIFLTETACSDGRKLIFSHSFYAHAICKRYDNDGKMKICCNKIIAGFYMDRLLSGDVSGISSSLLALPLHLAAAGDRDTLMRLLSNFEFIEAKCKAGYSVELIRDFSLLKKNISKQYKKTTKSEKISVCDNFQSLVSANLYTIQRHPSMLHQLALNHQPALFSVAGFNNQLETSLDSTDNEGYYLVEALVTHDKSIVSKRLSISSSSVTCVALSSSGRFITCGSTNGCLRVYDVFDDKICYQLRAKTSVSHLCFLTEKCVISGHSNGDINMWNVAGGYLVKSLQQHNKNISGICVSVVMHSMVSISFDKTLAVWKFSSDRQDQARLFKASHVYSLETDRIIPNCVAFHPKLLKVIVGMWDATIRIWDLENGKRVAIMRGSSSSVTSVKYSVCGLYILSTALYCNGVNVWSSEAGILVGSYGGRGGSWINSLDLIAKKDAIVAGGTGGSGQCDGIVKVWKSRLGKKSGNFATENEFGNALCCAFNKKCTKVAVGFHSNTLVVYDAMTLQIHWSKKIHSGTICCVCWSNSRTMTEKDVWATSELVVTGSDDFLLKVCRADDGKVVATCKGHTGSLLSVTCWQDWIASSSEDCSIILWSLVNICGVVRPSMLLRYHDAPATCLAFNLTGDCLASGGKDMKLAYWNISQSLNGDVKPENVVDNAHRDWITTCAWSDISNHLVTGSNDCTIKIWSGTTLLHHITNIFDSVTSSAYSQGCIICGTTSGLIHLWSHKGVIITTLNTGSNKRINSCDLSVVMKDEESKEEILDFEDDDSKEVVESSKHNSGDGELNWAAQIILEEWKEKHEKKLPGKSSGKKKIGLCDVGRLNVVTAQENGKVTLWNPLQGEEHATLLGSEVVNCVSCSDNSVAASCANGVVKIWKLSKDFDDSACHVSGHEAEISQLCSIHDVVISGCFAGWISLWKISGRQPASSLLRTLQAHDKRVTGISCLDVVDSVDYVKAVVCTCSYDSTVKMWNLSLQDSSSEIWLVETFSAKSPLNFMSAESPSTLFIGDVAGKLHKLQLTGNGMMPILLVDRPYACIRSHLLHPLTQKNVFIDDDGFILTPASLDETKRYFSPSDSSFVWFATVVTNVAENDRLLVGGDSEGVLHIPDLNIKKQIHESRITSILDLKDLIVTSSLDRTIKLWRKASLEQVAHYSSTSAVTAMTLVKPGNLIVCADVTGFISVLRLRNFSC